MADLPTPAELVTTGKIAFRVAIDPQGTGAVNLAAGSRNDVAVSALGAIGNRLALYAADRVTASRIATATGDDLDTLAADLFGLARKADVAATGYLQLTRAGTTQTSIPKGSRFGVPATATQPAIVFVASQDIPSSATSVVVPVACATTGVIGNIAGPSQVTGILDVLPDATWALNTSYVPSTPFGGGADAETDDELRARLRLTTPQATKQRGTRDAVLAGALNVPGVAFATPIEPQDGTVRLFAGDAAYNLPSVLSLAIQTELLKWRTFGVPVQVLPYNVRTVVLALSVYMARPLANYNVATITSDVVASVLEYFATRPQPDEYYSDAIIAAVFKANAEIQHVVLTATVNGTPTPNVVRPADTGYGVATSLDRYVTTAGNLGVTILPPNTL